MLPYKLYTIESQLSREEIINRLNRLTQSESFNSFQEKKKYFTGRIANDSFKIMQTSGNLQRNIVKGTITQNQNHNLIEFSIHPPSHLLAILVFISVSFTAFIISADNIISVLLKIAGLLAAGIIFLWDFYNSSSVLKKNLITLFTQEIQR